MDDSNLITKLPDEGYSPEAIANLDGAVEDFAESLLVIKPEDANLSLIHI